jgi:hypothetical protein
MNILGLRIGNTNTSAFVDTSEHPEPRLVEFEGEPVLPTAAVLRTDGAILVGQPALAYHLENPEALSLNLATATQQKPFFTKLCTCLIEKVKLYGESLIKDKIHQCILTVPALYDLSQKDLLKSAVEAAGLFVGGSILDPEAAILGAEPPEELSSVLVIRMGGTSTGVALLRRQSPWEIMSMRGDRNLGGHVIDEAIIRWYLAKRPDSPVPPLTRRPAEQAKIRLSTLNQTQFLDAEISRREFERLITPLLQKVCLLVDSTLNQAKEQGLSLRDLDAVLLNGGCAHIPALKQTLEDYLAKEIAVPKEPELVAARGATMKGRDLLAERQKDGWKDTMKEGDRPSISSIDTKYKLNEYKQARFSVQLDENVQFTIYRPRVMAPEIWYPLVTFAHLTERRPDAPPEEPDPIAEVKRQAQQVLAEKFPSYQGLIQDSTQSIPREGELTFLPEFPGFEVNPPRRTFLWMESVHREEFRLRAPLELDGQTVRGRLSVFLGCILVAGIPLIIKVDRQEAAKTTEPPLESDQTWPYRKIFASYSRKDIAIVTEFEEYLTGVGLGDRYLMDLMDLRAGEEWNPKLMAMIQEANIFQLFWSRNSMVSPFVEQEWQYALSLRRPYFVRPAYWEEPLPEFPERNLPPEELRRLHFAKIYPRAVSAGPDTPLSEEPFYKKELKVDHRSSFPIPQQKQHAPEKEHRSSSSSIAYREPHFPEPPYWPPPQMPEKSTRWSLSLWTIALFAAILAAVLLYRYFTG